MPISNANAQWTGTLNEGRGTMKPGHASEVSFTTPSRFEVVDGPNPEELIGAALAGCFSMALAANLERAGVKPETIRTQARVHMDKGEGGFGITRIELTTTGAVSGGDAATFKKVADETKTTCPVSRALRGVDIVLDAKLG
jgi:lipoyl-dependent peroxiredoxin